MTRPSTRKHPVAFWQSKSLAELSAAEWESLCDGCGKCCLTKLEFEDTGELCYTNLACRYLDHDSCRCTDYEHRRVNVPTCLSLREALKNAHAETFAWLPASCAYRLLYEGKNLPTWHPLITGEPDSVHRAGCSVQNKVICESLVPEEDWEEYIVENIG